MLLNRHTLSAAAVTEKPVVSIGWVRGGLMVRWPHGQGQPHGEAKESRMWGLGFEVGFKFPEEENVTDERMKT